MVRAKLITSSAPSRRAAAGAAYANDSKPAVRPMREAAEPANLEILRWSPDLARENRNLVTGRAKAFGGDDEIAFGAAPVRIEASGEERDAHQSASAKSCAAPLRMVF